MPRRRGVSNLGRSAHNTCSEGARDILCHGVGDARLAHEHMTRTTGAEAHDGAHLDHGPHGAQPAQPTPPTPYRAASCATALLGYLCSFSKCLRLKCLCPPPCW